MYPDLRYRLRYERSLAFTEIIIIHSIESTVKIYTTSAYFMYKCVKTFNYDFKITVSTLTGDLDWSNSLNWFQIKIFLCYFFKTKTRRHPVEDSRLTIYGPHWDHEPPVKNNRHTYLYLCLYTDHRNSHMPGFNPCPDKRSEQLRAEFHGRYLMMHERLLTAIVDTTFEREFVYIIKDCPIGKYNGRWKDFIYTRVQTPFNERVRPWSECMKRPFIQIF